MLIGVDFSANYKGIGPFLLTPTVNAVKSLKHSLGKKLSVEFHLQLEHKL